MNKIIIALLLLALLGCNNERKSELIYIEIKYTDGKKETIQYMAEYHRNSRGEWSLDPTWIDDKGCIRGLSRLHACNVKYFEIL